MTESLDVLVVESHVGAGDAAAAELATGARIHRCHRSGDPPFPCVGLVNAAACPLVNDIDVTLLVRTLDETDPTPLEDGASCAIRAGIPILELNDGPSDPFALWLTAHSTGDLLTDARNAVDHGFDTLRREIRRRVDPTLKTEGIDPHSMVIGVSAVRGQLDVRLGGLDVSPGVAQRLAVRTLDAVRSQPRRFRQVAVSVAEGS